MVAERRLIATVKVTTGWLVYLAHSESNISQMFRKLQPTNVNVILSTLYTQCPEKMAPSLKKML